MFKMGNFSLENIKWLKLILIKQFTSCLPNHNLKNLIFKLLSRELLELLKLFSLTNLDYTFKKCT